MTQEAKLYLIQLLNKEKNIIQEDIEAGCNAGNELELVNQIISNIK
ncbi:hypothetical protein [Oceanobacillus sp. FSL H7-0719]